MSEDNWDLEAGSGFQPDMERVDIPVTIIDLDSSESQDLSETNDTAEDQQYAAPVSSHPIDQEIDDHGRKAKEPSPEWSGSPKMESAKLDHDLRKDNSVGRGKVDVDRRRGTSDRWGLSSSTNEEKRDRDGFSPRDGRNRPSSRGRYGEVLSPRRHRSPRETTTSSQVATREPGMSRDAESRGRRDMWSSVVNSSESKRGADMWGPLPGRLTNSPPPPGMDDRRHQKSRSISPRGGRGRLRRNRSRSRSRSRSISRSRSPYGSRRGDRRPPAGQVCRDFAAGRCRRGMQCRFSHQDSTSHNRYNSPSDHPRERDRDRERDKDRERERDRDREREIERNRERYPTRDDRDNLYDSRGQIEYLHDKQSSQGYRSNYDEPPYNSTSNRSSERCFDFSIGRCTRGDSCRFVHHDASSGHGALGMRDEERERGWDERERDGGSRSRVANFDDRENDVSMESDRDKRAKRKETCKFFLEGRCGRGQGCRFSHDVRQEVHGEDVSEQSWSNKMRDEMRNETGTHKDVSEQSWSNKMRDEMRNETSTHKDVSEQSWSNKMRDEMHNETGTHNPYAVHPKTPNLSFTSQVQVPQQPLPSFYPVNQNSVIPSPVNQSLVNPNPVTGGATTALGSVLGHPPVNSYTSASSNPNHNIPGYNLQGQTMVATANMTQSILGPNPDQSFPPPPPPPPLNQPNPKPSNLVTSEQAANIDIKAYLSQILANNPGGSTSIPSIPAAAQPTNNPVPHESPVTPPVEIEPQEVKKEEVVLGQKQKMRPNPNQKPIKETKGIKLFKCALVEVVKDLLKPSWKDGQLSREAHKTIVKKVVDKVTGTMEAGVIPQTQEKIDTYLSHSKGKLTKLVQAYVEKYVKPDGN